ncbi:MAG: DUF3303 family protein [Acidobacteriota bacterium]
MIVETFREGPEAVYRRLAESGRSLPDGVTYVDSWVDEEGRRCFQLMESPSLHLLTAWTRQWNDLVDFDVVPVLSSAEAARRFGPGGSP